MPEKKNNNFLIGRIYESTKHIQDDIKDINGKQGKIFDKLGEHDTTLGKLETRTTSLEKTGGGFNLFKFIKMILGRG